MDLRSFFGEVQNDWGLLGSLLIVAGALLIGFIVHQIFFKTLKRWSLSYPISLITLLQEYLYKPSQLAILTLSVLATIPLLGLTYYVLINHVLSIILIAILAYFFINFVGLVREVLIKRYDVSVEDNLYARKVATQFRIVERVIIFITVVVAISIALMTFERIRQVGVSILASAGIVGIIVGFAAQKSLGTILAGIQIALSQPIRIDDVVIVEGEWGRIEEINLTYVVVRIWDERRLVVPITYFIEKPFQSWTRVSSELIGTVFIYADYSTPMEAMRKEFNTLLEESPLWDKRVAAMQVTDANERTIQIRMLASAKNSGSAFDLRCMLREKMIAFLQQNYPGSLPRTRMELDQPISGT